MQSEGQAVIDNEIRRELLAVHHNRIIAAKKVLSAGQTG
jgi:hypothetical protein